MTQQSSRLPFSPSNLPFPNHDKSWYWDNVDGSYTYVHKNGSRTYVGKDGRLVFKDAKNNTIPIKSFRLGKDFLEVTAASGAVLVRRKKGSSWHRDADGNVTVRHRNGAYNYFDKYGNATKRNASGLISSQGLHSQSQRSTAKHML